MMERGPESVSEPAPEASTSGPVVFSKRSNRGNIRKKPTYDDGGEEVLLLSAKRQARSSQTTAQNEEGAKLKPFAFESSNTLQQHTDGGATRALETETAHDRDGR